MLGALGCAGKDSLTGGLAKVPSSSSAGILTVNGWFPAIRCVGIVMNVSPTIGTDPTADGSEVGVASSGSSSSTKPASEAGLAFTGNWITTGELVRLTMCVLLSS
jgi:hypothetical protein